MKDKGSDGRPPQIHIDQAVIENYGLNHNAGWLYVVIVSHVNGKTGVAFPSLARLAKLTGMSKPTVIKYMKILEDKKLIEVIRENVEGTSEKDVNHYRVLPVNSGKTVLPPSKEDATETDVVKPYDYVKKPVDNGSKAELPQVVKPVDSNHLEFNQSELTKDKSSKELTRPRKSTNKHPELIYPVKEALIPALDYNPADVNKTLDSQLFRVASDLVNSDNPVLPEEVASLIVYSKQGEKNFKIWYIAPKVADWRKSQRKPIEFKPPSSSGAVSPNGKAPLKRTPEDEAAFQKYQAAVARINEEIREKAKARQTEREQKKVSGQS